MTKNIGPLIQRGPRLCLMGMFLLFIWYLSVSGSYAVVDLLQGVSIKHGDGLGILSMWYCLSGSLACMSVPPIKL